MQLPPQFELAARVPRDGCSPAEAQAYTRWLATQHYENFNVVSWLLPRDLHQHFYNVYAYCRWADDLGDEVADPSQALALLDAWEAALRCCYDRTPLHPVFIALRPTIEQFQIPITPFADLLKAFRQDQTLKRYADWDAVLGYCRYSANPVGHLVLYLCGHRDAERQRLSDHTCTALQLANFWQDVRVDLEKDRIYIPLEDLARFRYSEEQLLRQEVTPEFRQLMRFEVARARGLFESGLPLAGIVDRRLAADIELFSRGGLEILRLIEEQDYDVLSRRPALTGRRKLRLLAGALFRKVVSR
ncbi:MAG: squalene synthase HpnC [Candidatus Acidiferrales bacterium]